MVTSTYRAASTGAQTSTASIAHPSPTRTFVLVGLFSFKASASPVRHDDYWPCHRERDHKGMTTPGLPDNGSLVPLALYSAALDEVYRLRTALEYEARVTEAHLTLKSFPKSRRVFAEDQVQRMRDAARGDRRCYRGVLDLSWRQCQGAIGTLTRWRFEQESSG